MDGVRLHIESAGKPAGLHEVRLAPPARPGLLREMCDLVLTYQRRLQHPAFGGALHPFAGDAATEAAWREAWTWAALELGCQSGLAPVEIRLVRTATTDDLVTWAPYWAERVRDCLADGLLPVPATRDALLLLDALLEHLCGQEVTASQ